ncbi:hypothetical protein PHYPO_G00066510 [Pangasianodon hypophthalmus]|uniref:Integrase zinc-binding domain-containing protein n=1 Tax=Pangasianodon hypophthalmus TaxID=310915 RepID=A0A5N5M2R6_PANHP|nr:hypothetical protein PHYPO_G00066510 [Pangasianodon hypophthalmus]
MRPSSSRAKVLQWGHSSPLTAHPGARRTLDFLKRRFWWPSMEKDWPSGGLLDYYTGDPGVFLLLFLENGVLAAGSSSEDISCCFQVFANGSAVYRLNNTVESSDTRWNRNKTPIKDEVGNVDKNIVMNSGKNWIMLTNNYSDISFSFQGPEVC